MAWLIILGFTLLHLLSTTFFVLLTIRLVVGYRAKHDPALKLVGNRFALGEISEEEFIHRRLVLEGEVPST
jgi:uncharacterized membrane protein